MQDTIVNTMYKEALGSTKVHGVLFATNFNFTLSSDTSKPFTVLLGGLFCVADLSAKSKTVSFDVFPDYLAVSV